jgi:hypothetical protein
MILRWVSRWGLCLVLIGSVVSIAGCATVGSREVGPEATAKAFRNALSTGQGSRACSLLSPAVIESIQETDGSACAQAVLAEPTGVGGTRTVDVYGRQARVVLPDDTIFLSQFGREWRVIAAGCSPRAREPYDCAIGK